MVTFSVCMMFLHHSDESNSAPLFLSAPSLGSLNLKQSGRFDCESEVPFGTCIELHQELWLIEMTGRFDKGYVHRT